MVQEKKQGVAIKAIARSFRTGELQKRQMSHTRWATMLKKENKAENEEAGK